MNETPLVTDEFQTKEYAKVKTAVLDSKDNPDDPTIQVARRNDVSRKQLIRGRAVLGHAITVVHNEYKTGRLSLTTAAELATLPGGMQAECLQAMRKRESSSVVVGLLGMIQSRNITIRELTEKKTPRLKFWKR